jgi:hypothetical protein
MSDDLDFGSDFAQDIDDMLAEEGRQFTLRRGTKRSYNPATGKTTGTDVVGTIFGVVVPKKEGYINNEEGIDIGATTLRAYLSGANTAMVPKQGDVLTDGVSSYDIETVDVYDPQGVALLYECKVSK